MSIKLCIYLFLSFYPLSLCAAQYQKVSSTQKPMPINDYKSLVDVMRERREHQTVKFDFSERKGPASATNGSAHQPIDTTKG